MFSINNTSIIYTFTFNKLCPSEYQLNLSSFGFKKKDVHYIIKPQLCKTIPSKPYSKIRC